MVKVFIIHGTYGNPEENWFPWLKEELEKLGCDVCVPAFPGPPEHSLDSWLKTFDQYVLDQDTILIGHSIGCAFILNILEKLNHPIKAGFLVGGFLKKLNIEEFVKLNKTFVEKPFDWETIKKNCPQFFVFNSDNDPYVPIEKGEELSKHLDVDLHIIKGAGHFNQEAGYKKFEHLLELVKEEL